MWSSISWFWFAFPWWLMMLSIFLCTYWPFVNCLWRSIYANPLPVLKTGLSFYCWVGKFFAYSRYKSFIRYVICKYILLWVLFHFLDGILWSVKFLSYNEVQFICFLLLSRVLLMSYIRRHCQNQVYKDLLMFSPKNLLQF